MIWCTYGAVLNNPGIWLPNLTAIIMGSYYWATYYNNCPAGANHLPGPMSAHFAGVGAIAAGVLGAAYALPVETSQYAIGITGDIICVAMFTGPLVAIKTVMAEKSTKSLPFAFTLVLHLKPTGYSRAGRVVRSASAKQREAARQRRLRPRAAVAATAKVVPG